MASSKLTRAERTAKAEGHFDAFVEAVENRLAQIVDAHNDLDRRFEDLHYKLLFVMQTITVRRKISDASPLVGAPQIEEASLFEFFQRDGPAFIAKLKAEADALTAQFREAEARAESEGRLAAQSGRDAGSRLGIADVERLATSKRAN